MQSTRPKGETRVERMEKWLRNQPVLSVVILIATILAGSSLKQEKTLELARTTAKAEFSRRLGTTSHFKFDGTNPILRKLTVAPRVS